MGYSASDVYYQPEHFGLSVVGEVNWEDESYSFNMTVVWADNNGQLYWASDSGCSCPSPFENFTVIADLESGSFNDLTEYLSDRVLEETNSPYGIRDERDYFMPQVVEVLNRARMVARG